MSAGYGFGGPRISPGIIDCNARFISRFVGAYLSPDDRQASLHSNVTDVLMLFIYADDSNLHAILDSFEMAFSAT